MRPLSAAIDRQDEFAALIAEIRTTYKRRRNLMERLARARP